MAFYLAQFPALWIAAIYLNYVIHRTQPAAQLSTIGIASHGDGAADGGSGSVDGGGSRLMTRVCATAAMQLAPNVISRHKSVPRSLA